MGTARRGAMVIPAADGANRCECMVHTYKRACRVGVAESTADACSRRHRVSMVNRAGRVAKVCTQHAAMMRRGFVRPDLHPIHRASRADYSSGRAKGRPPHFGEWSDA